MCMKKFKTSLVFLVATNFLGARAEEGEVTPANPNLDENSSAIELNIEESFVKNFDAEINYDGVTVARFISLTKDVNQFDSVIDRVKETNTEVILDENTKVSVIYKDIFTEVLPSLVKRYEVEELPMTLFFKKGQLVCKTNETSEESLIAKIQEAAKN